jgi:hypothetical protein
MNCSATIANSLWIGSSLPSLAKFRRALDKPAEVQSALLRNLLGCNGDCAYGRAHHFREICNYDEFVRRVPLVDYDDIEPWIERIRRGETRVLTNDPVTHLIPTSGSTGARKLIPFTAGLQRELNRAIGPWIAGLAWQCPQILFGPAYWSITPALPPVETGPSAVPIGFADDASYLGGVNGRLIRAALAAPDELGRITNLDEFRYRTLLCLLRQRELRLISIWHPSFLALLLEALPNHWEKILTQLYRGERRRARELERADPDEPETLWPRLQVISCWGDGPAESAMADLRGRFPKALVQAKGLLATEAFVTIPFAGLHPVAVRSHFFEFIDESGRVHLALELREQQTYEVVVTTGGGLWRYRLRDRVRVAGFVGGTPSLQFLGRSGNVSDLFGEKLSETFVAQTIRETLAISSTTRRFALLAPDEDAAGCGYTLYLEGAPPRDLAETLDQALRRNPHYAGCRDLGQLLPVRVFAITSGGYEAFVRRSAAKGVRLGDIKPLSLSREPGWSQLFPGAYVQPLSKILMTR